MGRKLHSCFALSMTAALVSADSEFHDPPPGSVDPVLTALRRTKLRILLPLMGISTILGLDPHRDASEGCFRTHVCR